MNNGSNSKLETFEDNQIHARFLIHDRDTKFSAGFRRLFKTSGTRCLRTPLLAPHANAFCEAWIGGLKRESLNYFLCFGLDHLDYICQSHVRFHNQYRPHRGLGNLTIPAAATGSPDPPAVDPEVGTIRCQQFLGGLLRHYYRDAV